jgi:hypothetical protein
MVVPFIFPSIQSRKEMGIYILETLYYHPYLLDSSELITVSGPISTGRISTAKSAGWVDDCRCNATSAPVGPCLHQANINFRAFTRAVT